MFSILSRTNFANWITFNLSSANAFSLDWSKIFLFGKELTVISGLFRGQVSLDYCPSTLDLAVYFSAPALIDQRYIIFAWSVCLSVFCLSVCVCLQKTLTLAIMFEW